jgi:hypothetical protein
VRVSYVALRTKRSSSWGWARHCCHCSMIGVGWRGEDKGATETTRVSCDILGDRDREDDDDLNDSLRFYCSCNDLKSLRCLPHPLLIGFTDQRVVSAGLTCAHRRSLESRLSKPLNLLPNQRQESTRCTSNNFGTFRDVVDPIPGSRAHNDRR